MYTGPPESPFWLSTPWDMVNHPLLTPSTVPQVSPVITPKWQIGWPGVRARPGLDSSRRPSGRMLFAVTLSVSTIDLVVGDHLVGGHRRAAGCVVPERREMADDVLLPVGDDLPRRRGSAPR